MSTVSIGTAARIERLRERLSCGLRELERQGYRVSQKEVNRGGYTFLSIGVEGEPAAVPGGSAHAPNMAATAPAHASGASGRLPPPWRELLRRQLAAVLCEVIVSDFREVFLQRIVAAHYPQLERDERTVVVDYAERVLREIWGDERGLDAIRAKVLLRLLEYLESNDELVVEGFITFRLKDYVDLMEEAVEGAIDEILLEREYEEFVHLLQCFVVAQESRTPEIHLMCSSSGLALEDSEGREITLRVAGPLDVALRPEDLVISALVGMAPRRVIVHGTPRQEEDEGILRTVRRIFTDRLSLCPGCPRCPRAEV
ncbi:MAG TPA: hypothetical protein GX513_09590 [Firmicutes bacterium]|nr:hypothetical protein [Bacillota bacterium]